jgi:two-component system, OmpR family, sensor histidine kinase KdpD
VSHRGKGATGRQDRLDVPVLPSGGLPPARRWTGLALAGVGLPTLTVILTGSRNTLALGSVLLLYLLAVVVVAVVGGILPAVIAALASFLLANWFLTPPYHTFVVEQRDSIIALVVFVIVAVTVSVTVDLAARQRVAMSRSRLEAELLSRFTAEPIGDLSPVEVLDQIRTTFGMTTVALLESRDDGDAVAGIVGPPLQGHPAIAVPAGPGLRLVAEGPELFAEDRRLLIRLAATAARAMEGGQLAGAAAQARQLAEVDRLRAALLAAVSHELRTPLAGIKAAVSSLRQHDITWTPAEQAEFLATIEESADRLDDLIANLLAMSRLQAGALSVAARPVALDEVVARALLGLRLPDVKVDVPDDLPLALADPGLLERVIANLVTNARRHATAGTPIRIDANGHRADADADAVRLRVVDSGPGVPDVDWQRMFVPFQRLDDRPTGGVGLGLAIAHGFTEAMGGTLTPSHTPGGGLTMTVTLPVAP